jgi:hypothetical protein
MTGIERIAAERKRQIEEEGWTAEHDDQWNYDELAMAALCYVIPGKDNHGKDNLFIKDRWPLNDGFWKPTPDNRIRELEKAGALIAAEIDRLLRLGG